MTTEGDSTFAYATPAAFRMALERRLAEAARATGTDLSRLRRRVAFERLIAHLCADDGDHSSWVLKGGLALELRLANACRATRDVDLATLSDEADGQHVRYSLFETLTANRASDYFTFAVAAPRELAADLAGRPGWRFNVEVRIGGKVFDSIRVDVVARAEEIEGSIESLTFPSVVAFAGYPATITVLAVDVNQHAAEKFHALTREYGDRPSTRVKDLVDLVLLIEHQLLDIPRLADRMRTVFSVRGTHDMPTDLQDPPAAWQDDYRTLTADVGVRALTTDAAMVLIRSTWKACMINGARD
jgi:Nucleotidyl transferase AbiEii toxin, Type IV TA system